MRHDSLRQTFDRAVKAFRANQIEEAERLVRKLLKQQPGLLPAMNLQAALAASQRRYAEAEKVFLEVIRRDPRNADARLNLARVLRESGRLPDAEQCYREALAIQPSSIAGLNGLGMVLRDLGQFEAAESTYSAALAINPNDSAVLNNFGTLMRMLGRLPEAETYLRRAVSCDSKDARAFSNLGNVLADAGRITEAEGFLRRAVDLMPGLSVIAWNLALFLSLHGDLTEAIDVTARAVRGDTQNTEYLSMLIGLRQKACEWNGVNADCGRLLTHLIAVNDAVALPFVLLSMRDATRQHQHIGATNFATHKMGPLLKLPPMVSGMRRGANTQVRIGYISADFHDHATSQLLVEVIEKHDRAKVKCFAYSYGPDDGSEMRRRIRQAFDVFKDVREEAHESTAHAIVRDQIDILVDLKGYTQNNRLQIAALRPAGIQVNWLGYPGTYGHRRLADYVIGDPVVTPLEHADDYAEKIAQMPYCYQPNDQKRKIGAKPSRREVGLPEDGFVFCCFNQSYKVTGEVFSVWCALLAAIPRSVLWLLDPEEPRVRAALMSKMREYDLDVRRLILAPRVPSDMHIGRLQLADLALDTFPYNSHTTGSDALWACVPVVTRIGETFASRVAASLLRAIDLPEFIARDLNEYYQLCLRLASDSDFLSASKKRLQRNHDTCALFDSDRFVRNLEQLYFRMLEDHQSGKWEHIGAADA
jgi:predicted O-linked N-acetylglucosamine transferase (SPINDLY family)